ncbi:MAG: single-stranded DNA-binding protein [Acidobacteriota bacterium]|nr:single-stranded DNA-binding protein [Acidobacteriota bacterium]
MRDINSLNKVLLIGRLGGKPELRYLPQTERAVARFTIATNEKYFNPSTNESDIRTEWHRIVAWGKLAEFCENYLTQGKQIYLEGKLRTRSWQDKEGNKRYTTEIEAQNIVFLGKREDQGKEDFYQEPGAAENTSDANSSADIKKEEDEDIPF